MAVTCIVNENTEEERLPSKFPPVSPGFLGHAKLRPESIGKRITKYAEMNKSMLIFGLGYRSWRLSPGEPCIRLSNVQPTLFLIDPSCILFDS